MKRLKETLAILSLSLIVCSCGSFINNHALLSIQKGMTQKEVTKLLGKPDYRRFDEQGEQWEYKKAGGIGNYGTTILVDFNNGQVSNLNSFESIPNPPAVAVCPPAQVVPTIRPSYPPHYNDHPSKHSKGMNEYDFQQLYNKVKSKPFDDDKLETLASGAEHRQFSTQQCIKLMSIYTFDDDKLKILEILADRIVDGENYDEIIDSFTFISSQNKAKKILGLPKRK